jgi:hypothetical protein
MGDQAALRVDHIGLPTPAVWFWYVQSTARLCPIRSAVDPIMQVFDIAIEVCLVVLPRQAVHPGRSVLLISKNASLSSPTLMWWKSVVNFSFFLCFAACRMRPSACDTLSRS